MVGLIGASPLRAFRTGQRYSKNCLLVKNHRIVVIYWQEFFIISKKKLMYLTRKANIFGEVNCHMYTIEWQKRRLLHDHILIWLKDSLHFQRVDDFNSVEIPNPQEDPDCSCIRTKQMVHGPCGSINPHSPYIKDGICTKRYPSPFLKEIQTGQDGYPLYRSRSSQDGGFTASMNFRGSQVSLDNTWIAS
ncbi:hypothetical protein AVEN_247402-1 [Araneus ventricosus]|uniref:Helitron helicase-like domain-containing protein n=1 Tax=Araneus ventricosus TaxID=182803 RepID=A0A4Y2M3I5_ARAVE|nr:hypothetical protein AVEN_247402-1 [Araneus ventricosus]